MPRRNTSLQFLCTRYGTYCMHYSSIYKYILRPPGIIDYRDVFWQYQYRYLVILVDLFAHAIYIFDFLLITNFLLWGLLRVSTGEGLRGFLFVSGRYLLPGTPRYIIWILHVPQGYTTGRICKNVWWLADGLHLMIWYTSIPVLPWYRSRSTILHIYRMDAYLTSSQLFVPGTRYYKSKIHSGRSYIVTCWCRHV